jgi:hypothetical protein
MSAKNHEKYNEKYNEVKIFLEGIRSELETKHKDLFYINLLIGDSINSYINSNSKPLAFNEALKKVNDLIV